MALHDLIDIEVAVPDPQALADFWTRRGLVALPPAAGSGPGGDCVLGTPERPSQLRIREGAYRHVAELRLACETDADLVAIAARLERLGVYAVTGDGWLSCADPLGDHTVRVEVVDPAAAAAAALAPAPATLTNAPGRRDRVDRRAPACLGRQAHAPRRVGHVVFGSPDVAASTALYAQGLGFKISDCAAGGIGVFLRCSSDHHNLLLAPAPVPCVNHYAMEMDDVDAIGLAAAATLAERADCSVAGLGRHVVGANLFWYLLDPAGGMFELFADMDQIVDDERWEREERRDDWDPFTIGAWMPGPAAPDFWMPADIDAIAAARAGAGR